MNFLTFAAPIGAIAAAGVALAQPADVPRHRPGADVTRQQMIDHVDRRFGMLDGNGDGRVTPDEARQHHAQRRGRGADALFERLDGNRDGNVSRAEFDQAHARRAERAGQGGMRARHRGGRAMMGRGGGRGGHRMLGRLFGEQGYFTREQMRERALAHFDRVDADRNGTLTAAERRQAHEQRRGHMGGHERAGD